jgi:hypothetical protein
MRLLSDKPIQRALPLTSDPIAAGDESHPAIAGAEGICRGYPFDVNQIGHKLHCIGIGGSMHIRASRRRIDQMGPVSHKKWLFDVDETRIQTEDIRLTVSVGIAG